MATLKTPLGLRNGEFVMIKDIGLDERGLKCNCICPVCEGALIARLGDVREHHFAHSSDGCDAENAFLISLYLLLREVILTNPIELPDLAVYWGYSEKSFSSSDFEERVCYIRSKKLPNKTMVVKKKPVKFESAEIKYLGEKPIALLLSVKNSDATERKLAIRIKLPSTYCKSNASTGSYSDRSTNRRVATIDLNMSGIRFSTLTINEMRSVLCKKISEGEWIFSQEAIKALEDVNKENNRWREKRKTEQARANQNYYSYTAEPIQVGFSERSYTCSYCGETKPSSEFVMYNSNRKNLCRACSRK